MPGSTTFFPATADEETVNTSDPSLMSQQPPPVAPRTTSVSIQSWPSATSGGEHNYGDTNRHARSASMDSLESSGSSSSGGGSSIANHRSADLNTVEYIPTRTVGKAPKLASHNPLQFVKVHSPLYKKAEHQIKLTKEVKVTRQALKEGEEEWQSNLDNWKSRRRKVSEKVIQRAEEMRQIEAEEQLRQEQILQQQRKIKKFSEIVEKRSISRSYNLDLYIGQGDDSGLGGTPEPDDVIDSQNSILRSDTSEGMTSEAESIDSDIHKYDKVTEKEPPKVPQKPQTRLKREKSINILDDNQTIIASNRFSDLSDKNLSGFDNFSSTEPSDIDGHAGDSETISSEDDASYLSDGLKSQSHLTNICDQVQDNYNGIQVRNDKTIVNLFANQVIEVDEVFAEDSDVQISDQHSQSYSICIKPGDNRGFGFTLKGGKDQGCAAYIDNVTKFGPADVTGLKEGDHIISLNGELASECSHASLIFTVKQAVYTGILDLVIRRSIKNAALSPEIKPKSTNKKSSFAEKLALFSSGVKSTSASSEESKSPITSTKAEEVKGESLVLRRRSAFENGKNGSNVVYRRSSCLSKETPNISENVEKRLSVDLTLAQYNHQENGIVKKGPPPPVPVKPKLKPKIVNDLYKNESTKVRTIKQCDDSSDSIEANNFPKNMSPNVADTENCLSNEYILNERIKNSECLITNLKEKKFESESSLNDLLSDELESFQTNSYSDKNDYLKQYSPVNYANIEVSKSSVSNNSQFSGNSETLVEDFITNKLCDFTLDEIPASSVSNNTSLSDTEFASSNSLDNKYKIETSSNTYNQYIDQRVVPESFTSVNCASAERSLHEGIEKSVLFSDETPPLPDSEFHMINNDDIIFEENCLETNSMQTGLIPSGISQNEGNGRIDTNLNTAVPLDLEGTAENTYDIESMDNFYVENSNDEESNENISNIQCNPSPLCLPLEKNDDDDVISASTTTSSETPDTETVIETLPSNLSPLPNDESNGEESSKHLNSHQDKKIEHILPTSVSNSSSTATTASLCIDNNLPETLTYKNVPIDEAIISENYDEADVDDICTYSEDQDNEYCRELDESIDHITSLDVIDEIEQRLMHQLEQQDETYEGMDECLTAQLEQDINKQWLYFSEEAELLDDLTPRNMEPPQEPPPPPPPPDIEMSEKKVIPITRTNSTKRIKKELWRRRSDFLGLDSSEGIDVDNILPPPPGLEEILKQEREQNQWLEKRLSLAETDLSTPLYSNESIYMESQDYATQSDYSEYVDDTEDSNLGSIDGQSENWKETIGEENVFEPSDFQYVTPIDMTNSISEENSKINESPQHKTKQNIQNLGAAPKAKIMDSNKWITEKIAPASKKSIEPVFSQTSYNQNYWLAQDDERKRSVQCSDSMADRRYSMPPFTSTHPDVTVRTWGDREYEFQKQRPRSAVWNSTANDGDYYEAYSPSHKQDVMRTHSLDSHREISCDTSNILETEVHKCSYCGKGLCEGSAMGIEALRLYFHIECFCCCLCHMRLGNGLCGTDVQVKNNQLFCPRCFTAD